MKRDEGQGSKSGSRTQRGLKLVTTRRLTDPNRQLTSPATAPPTVSRRDTSASKAAATRNRKICERAYRLAELRGFVPGHELADWLQAEREFDATSSPARDNQETGSESMP
jgi:hypothetical protein